MEERGATEEMLGLALVMCGVQFSVLANAVVKLLADLPLLQTMQARFFLQWLCSVTLSVVLRARGHAIHLTGLPGHRLLLTARSCLYSCALGTLWCALRCMPVGEATAIIYLHPVICGLLAWCFLGEALGPAFFAQASCSCLGVLMVVEGSFLTAGTEESSGETNGGALYAVASCFCFASGNFLARRLKGVHPLEVQVYSDTLVTLVFLPAALALDGGAGGGISWTRQQLGLLVLFTAFGLATSFLAIMGFRLAPAVKAALFMYLEVPSAFAVQVFFFGEVPEPVKLCGAALIMSAAAGRLMYEWHTTGKMSEDMAASSIGSPALVAWAVENVDDVISPISSLPTPLLKQFS